MAWKPSSLIKGRKEPVTQAVKIQPSAPGVVAGDQLESMALL